MMRVTLGFPALVLAAALCPVRAAGQDIWAAADEDTPRLTPAAFRKLPPHVVAALESRRCTVPQVWFDTTAHNVVRGAFDKKGQTDWAVLCSRARASTILIVWGGTSSCPEELEVREDKAYLQKIAGGQIRFSRKIEVASPEFIRKMHERYGGEPLPPLDHQGIEDRFAGKGSVVRYCYDRHWVELTGAQ